MSTLNAKDTYTNLLKKGFREAKNKSDDHKWVEFWNDNKLTRIKTKISHGEKELNDFLIGHMSKQTYLKRKDFIAFAKCELTEEGYINLLRSTNPEIIPLEPLKK